MPARLTQDEWIEKAKKVHGERYDYSFVKYHNAVDKIKIICPLHGEFFQVPNTHLRGSGCKLCGNDKVRQSLSFSKQEFIVRCIGMHQNRYDYSKVKYVNYSTKVEIVCPSHGSFFQHPQNHLNGFGCSKCSGNYSPTTEEFIEKAKLVHGDKYNYNKVEYKKNNVKILIECPVHGYFEQIPDSHLNGSKCPRCANDEHPNQKLTTEEFINRAREIHGNKYGYEKSLYINTETVLVISCPKHGDFTQTPHSHLQGSGCLICAGKKQLTTEEFIAKAISVHGTKYDYRHIVYINGDTKVKIVCQIHGEYLQTPDSHIKQKSGCPACSGHKRLDLNEFIKRSKKIHGDKYDYSQTDIKDCKRKVKIICPQHGEFFQIPTVHMRGGGCVECVGLKTGTTEEFIEKAKQIHGNKYDYRKVVYVNRNTKVIIGCPKHGEFEQIPYSHLFGKGCQSCKESHGERLISRTLDKLRLKYKRQAKFDKCRLRHKLPFDFMVKISNQNGFLIEYQGRQHYEPVKWRPSMTDDDAKKEFLQILQRDKIKRDFVKRHNIPFLEIPYQNKDNIPKLIENFVKELS